MSYVLEGLYLGSLDDVCEPNKLRESGVTHLLTVETRPPARRVTEGLVTKFVHAFDVEGQDLLAYFDDCFLFIDEGRQAGGVFVHCFVGQSRSATIVIGYLMNKMGVSLSEATTMLKKSRPQIGPNRGFLQQLELFERMGNIVDKTNMEYKLHRLNNMAQRIQEAQGHSAMPQDLLSADPSLHSAGDLGVHYKCKKCRRPLFKDSAKLTHQTGKGSAAFDWRAKLSSEQLGLEAQQAEPCSKSLFIEPVQWMGADILQQTGKLTCPKCSAKIGSFSWFGEYCPCGTWVIPAFHVTPSKVDECKPRPVLR